MSVHFSLVCVLLSVFVHVYVQMYMCDCVAVLSTPMRRHLKA